MASLNPTGDMPTPKAKPSLIIICHLPPPVHGASTVGQQIVESRKLHAAFDCTVIPIRMTSGVGDLKSFALSKMVAACKIYLRLLSQFFSGRPNAVYLTPTIDGYGLLRDCICVLICRIFSVRCILHLHMRGVRNNYEQSASYRFLYRTLFKNTDIIHLSENLYDDVAPLISPEKFHVVANGVVDPGVQEASDATSNEQRSTSDLPTILFLSNLDPEKGPLDLLEASQRLTQDGVAHKVIFAGAKVKMEVTAAIADAAAASQHNSIILTGPVYDNDKQNLLKHADIFVFPSYYRYECQPLSIMEAMAYALPIAATKEGAIPELLNQGECGVLFPAHDIESLTYELRQLIANTNRRQQLGKKARVRFLQHYSVEAFEQRFVATMQRLVNNHSADGTPIVSITQSNTQTRSTFWK